MLSYFVLIVVTTVTWIIPIGIQGYRPTLHKRHNDDVYKVNLKQDFNSKYLVGRRQSSGDSNHPSFPYHENNLMPNSAVKPVNTQRDDVLLSKIEELATLAKVILTRCLDSNEKSQRKNRQTVLNEANDPKIDQRQSANLFAAVDSTF